MTHLRKEPRYNKTKSPTNFQDRVKKILMWSLTSKPLARLYHSTMCQKGDLLIILNLSFT